MNVSHLRLASIPGRAAPSTIRVVLADDHSLVRRSLRALLDGETDVEVVAEATDLPAVIRQTRELGPHVLVLDLIMPGDSSTEVLRRLRDQVPETAIVVLTMEDSPALAQQALGAGAIGFVLKEFADDELLQAVRSAACGEKYVSPRVAARLSSLDKRDGRQDGHVTQAPGARSSLPRTRTGGQDG
jgi:two-component system response regulator NreC